jgi:large subunit ribosomal protein L21
VYAIVRSGGKQYRVQAGDTIHVERLSAEVGDSVQLEDVLLVGGEGEPQVGRPLIASARVVGIVVEHGRDQKVRVFKYKKRKHYRKTRGHRQDFTVLKIDAIQA